VGRRHRVGLELQDNGAGRGDDLETMAWSRTAAHGEVI
jgi:hypothetical protein